jgi:hypothetical protein
MGEQLGSECGIATLVRLTMVAAMDDLNNYGSAGLLSRLEELRRYL